jgi:hypothetical protein
MELHDAHVIQAIISRISHLIWLATSLLSIVQRSLFTVMLDRVKARLISGHSGCTLERTLNVKPPLNRPTQTTTSIINRQGLRPLPNHAGG